MPVPAVQFIEHRGTQILRIEFSSELTNQRIREIISEARSIISQQPPESLLTLTILGEFHFDTETTRAFNEYVAHNKPYVRAGAVVGIAGLRKAVYNSLMIISHRKMRLCADEEEAKDFLASVV